MRKSYVKYVKTSLLVAAVMMSLAGCDQLKQSKEPEIGVIVTEKGGPQSDTQNDGASSSENVTDDVYELSENVYVDSENLPETEIANEGELQGNLASDGENSMENVFVDEGNLTKDVTDVDAMVLTNCPRCQMICVMA